MDVVCLGPSDASKCLILFSAVHGLEGLAGSAAQMAWLSSPQASALPPGVKVIVVHAVNAWGFAWRSRLTEDGVDLNRNFVDHANPPLNERYELYRHLTPFTDASQAGIDAFRDAPHAGGGQGSGRRQRLLRQQRRPVPRPQGHHLRRPGA